MVSLVVVNYNDYPTTLNFIHGIENYSNIDHIVVIDNKSTDGSFEYLKQLASEKVDVVQSDKNGGYGYGNNLGVNYLYDTYNSDICIIANPDVEFSNETINVLERYLRNNQMVAVVAPVMHNPQGQPCIDTAWNIPRGWQYVFSTCQFPFNKIAGANYLEEATMDSSNYQEVGAVAGSLLMIRVDAFLEVGGYDENIFLYGEENVIAIKLSNANYKTILVNDQSFIHRHSVSINKSIPSLRRQRNLLVKSRSYVLKRYYGFNSIECGLAIMLIRISDIIIIPINYLSRLINRSTHI